MDLYKFILLLLSLVFSLLLQIKLVAIRLWNVKKQPRSCVIRLVNYLWPRSVLTRPNIVPDHLALLINESQVNLHDICKLLVLACKYGIGQVSIYEPRGFFGNADCSNRLDKLLSRKSRSRFKYRLLPRPPVVEDWSPIDCGGNEVVYKSLSGFKGVGQRGGDIKDVDDVNESKSDVIGNGNDVVASSFKGSRQYGGENNVINDVILSKNGVSGSGNDIISRKNDVTVAADVIADQNHFLPPTLRVYLLGANAGRSSIARAAQASINCAVFQATKFEFSSFLNTLTQFSSPEADFALVFGKVPSMAGYPAMSLRLTELLFLSTHRSVTEANFVDWLETFSKRDRRRGK